MTTERTPRQIRLATALLFFGSFLLGAGAQAALSHWSRAEEGPKEGSAMVVSAPDGSGTRAIPAP
jgi:hypothetical protein